jgi:hypothetical protein
VDRGNSTVLNLATGGSVPHGTGESTDSMDWENPEVSMNDCLEIGHRIKIHEMTVQEGLL